MTAGAYLARKLAGRCTDGRELGQGATYHAVEAVTLTALCGAKPGRHSAGWQEPLEPSVVSCPRCRRLVDRLAAGGQAAIADQARAVHLRQEIAWTRSFAGRKLPGTLTPELLEARRSACALELARIRQRLARFA